MRTLAFSLRCCVAMLLAMLVACAGCERSASTSKPPSAATGEPRIVSLSPAISVILRDLGYERAIVGRHAYELILDPALPACGDQTGIDYEALLRVRPTHVFTQWGARELPERLRELAQREGWVLRDVNPLSIEQIAESTLELDAALSPDHAPRAAARKLASKVHALAMPLRRDGLAGSVLLLASVAPPAALGPGSCHVEMLTGLGAVSAVGEGSAYVELSREDLVRMDPWAIVVFAPRPRTGSDASRDVLAPLRDLPLRAVREGRAGVIDDPLGLLPSSAMLGVARELDELFASWRAKSGGTLPSGNP